MVFVTAEPDAGAEDGTDEVVAFRSPPATAEVPLAHLKEKKRKTISTNEPATTGRTLRLPKRLMKSD